MPRPQAHDFEPHKEEINHRYVHLGQSLRDVHAYFSSQYSFTPRYYLHIVTLNSISI